MLNKVQVIGHVGKDAELKYTPNGTPVCKFSVATTEKWKDASGEKQEKTEWFNISAWKKLAEICGEYVKKGMLVYVEGSLKSHEWEKDGEKRRGWEVTARTVKFLSKNPDAAQSSDPQASGQEITDEDIPL